MPDLLQHNRMRILPSGFKSLLFLFILLFLFSSLVFKTLNIPEKKLKGTFIPKPDVEFTIKGWFNADYQKQKEEYLNDNFGFHNTWVRIHNQIDFSLFGKANAAGIIIGKKNYMYELNYIKAYFGQDFIGEENTELLFKKIKLLQDTLKKKNIDFLLVFAAGKASYYPEYIPDELVVEKKQTNYETMLKYSEEYNINFIDFNNYFVKNKYSSKYPLYPQYGIHWSHYGMILAADSIIHRIEQFRKIKMPEFSWNKINYSRYGKYVDQDIVDGLNLLYKIRTFPMAYPEIFVQKDSSRSKPTVLVIADSFFWGMFDIGISREVFSDSRFWYYNNEVYPDNFTSPTKVRELNLKQEIEKQHVIVVLATEANLKSIGWGFIDNAYNVYFPEKLTFKEKKLQNEEIAKMIAYIKVNQSWFRDVERKARERKISVDSMLVIDALWAIKQQKLKSN